VPLDRRIDGSDPVARRTGGRYDRHVARSSRLAVGTLACPRCDAPVAVGAGRLTPGDPLGCPFCLHAGAVRDFLTLGAPTRPARVELHVVQRRRG
jgi:hypothetical protein